jgi:phospholipid/cholesterol/gamma-HCH transport system substrate-binding protein
MEEQSVKKIRLGAFVITATSCLILGLYFIGSKRNIFHSKINVSAVFSNISGLMPGNNVQFNGINVGTVSKVSAISDTAISVEFSIDKKITEFITQNALASIGTDGLLGNKLVNISPDKKGGLPLQEGSVMKTSNPIKMDNALRTLLVTNDNLKAISENLKNVSAKFNTTNSPLNLLTDTTISENIRSALKNLKQASDNSAILTSDLSHIVKDARSGKGTIGKLLNDTLLSFKLNKTISIFEAVSDSFTIITGNLKRVSEKMENGKGAFGTLLNDTIFAHNLDQSMDNIKNGSEGFNKNMQALQYSWPFKKGFRKQK